uniref:Uncharacterized protein n=1 Tax=Amphimedon queenslandica TaxID=400682 RepID=A0A1X7UCE9_AMPQE
MIKAGLIREGESPRFEVFGLVIDISFICVVGAVRLPVNPDLTLLGREIPFRRVSAFAAEKDTTAGSVALSATSLVVEGLPSIPTKLVEKIQRWVFVNLALLLQDASSKSEELLLQQHCSPVMIFHSVEQAQKEKKQIVDIVSWASAISIYVAVLAAALETTKKQVVGLVAHMYLTTELARDLGGGQWQSYDVEFRNNNKCLPKNVQFPAD